MDGSVVLPEGAGKIPPPSGYQHLPMVGWGCNLVQACRPRDESCLQWGP